jgi:hypothetical protein
VFKAVSSFRDFNGDANLSEGPENEFGEAFSAEVVHGSIDGDERYATEAGCCDGSCNDRRCEQGPLMRGGLPGRRRRHYRSRGCCQLGCTHTA